VEQEVPEQPEAPPARDRRRLLAAVGGGVAVLAVLLLLVVGLVNKDVGTRIDDALAAGDRPDAPDIELPVLLAGDGVGPEGASVSLDDLRGRVVVLNLWASWCGPCRTEAPLMEDLARAHRERDDGVLFLGLDTQDLSGDARAFAREYGLTYPSLRDGTDGAQRALEARGVPETWIIDREGRIAYHHIGAVTDPEQIEQPLRTLD
jgi:cytochrome c biogenesis protein CcmG, thiol:disulfide interchange protein DsbE